MAANLVPEKRSTRVVVQQSREHFRFDPPNLLLTTLKVAAVVAVVAIAERSTTFTDYNAPKQPVVFQPPNTLLTLLAPPPAPPVVKTPFNQEDWPNPRGSPVRDLSWSNTPEVIPPVVIPPAPAPFEQADWPNPRGSPVRDLTWTQSPKVPQPVTAFAVAEGQRSHGFTDYFAKSLPVVLDPPNTLALLTRPAVAAVVAPPFVQEDWPNPAKLGQRDLTWTQSPEVIPKVADIAVANRIPNQTDWPNPLRSPVRDLTWTQNSAVPPAVVASAGTAKPFLQNDWPNPVLRTPFKESGWVKFANIRDIPAQPTPPQQAGRSHVFTDFNAPKQPAQFDPPNTLLGGIPAQSTPPPVVASPPFSQPDWPNPVLRTVRIKTPQSFRPGFDVIVELQSSTFPFSLTEWPNPVRRTPFLESGWTRFANVGDIPARPTPAVQNPFNQDNWPNPIVRTVRIKTPQSFRPGFDVTVEAASSTFPFSQTDWPNPVRRISPKEWGFTRFANVSDVPQRFIAPTPFDQTDWPNPIKPWQRDFTWIQSPKVEQIVPEAASNFPPAFVQTEWPNPVLRTPFNESGWVRFANIGDIPAAAPVPVPPAPTDEVKPSGGRVDHEFKYAIEGRKTYAQKLRDLRIAQDAAEIIEQVALQQAATLEVDEIRNARELKRALRLAKVEDDARYLELLAERRELAKNEEIGALLYKAVQDEEDVLALLMIASQLL